MLVECGMEMQFHLKQMESLVAQILIGFYWFQRYRTVLKLVSACCWTQQCFYYWRHNPSWTLAVAQLNQINFLLQDKSEKLKIWFSQWMGVLLSNVFMKLSGTWVPAGKHRYPPRRRDVVFVSETPVIQNPSQWDRAQLWKLYTVRSICTDALCKNNPACKWRRGRACEQMRGFSRAL